MAWGIPDDSVDYVSARISGAHHATAAAPRKLLAETWRVLAGVGGTGEHAEPAVVDAEAFGTSARASPASTRASAGDIWGHVCLMTPGALEDMAKLVGYRRVVFNGKAGAFRPSRPPTCARTTTGYPGGRQCDRRPGEVAEPKPILALPPRPSAAGS